MNGTTMASGPILAAVAYNPLNMHLSISLIIIRSLFIGGVEGIVIISAIFPL